MFTDYVHALLGGVLIGLAAVLLLVSDGQIAGISGMVGGALRPIRPENGWRLGFLAGLVAGGLAFFRAGWPVYTALNGRSLGAIVAAGLLVGFGTQIGSGCTSGHGVCGIGRLSGRSLVATLTFMATGVLTVYIVEHLLNGNV